MESCPEIEHDVLMAIVSHAVNWLNCDYFDHFSPSYRVVIFDINCEVFFCFPPNDDLRNCETSQGQSFGMFAVQKGGRHVDPALGVCSHYLSDLSSLKCAAHVSDFANKRDFSQLPNFYSLPNLCWCQRRRRRKVLELQTKTLSKSTWTRFVLSSLSRHVLRQRGPTNWFEEVWTQLAARTINANEFRLRLKFIHFWTSELR